MADQLCTLVVSGVQFGVDVLRVQEVIRRQEMTGVPRSHDVVAGLINLRGQIVTAIDLRKRLGFNADADPSQMMNVVVRTDEGAVSFLVDDIGDVVEAGPLERERAPETLDEDVRDLITTVFKLDDSLLLQLDVDRLVDLPVAATAA